MLKLPDDHEQSLHSTWSTKDLAVRAACSVQHVRDLEREGVLPPAMRRANGYRGFSSRHLDALLSYRSLTAAVGPVEGKRLVRLAVHASRGATLAALDDAHARLDIERKALRQARVAVESIRDEPLGEPRASDAMAISELAEALGVRTSTLRHWESEGLLRPGRVAGARSYSPIDVRDARIVDQLRRSGHRIPELRALMERVRSWGDHHDLARAFDERERQLAARSWALLHAAVPLTRVLAPDGFDDAGTGQYDEARM